MLASRADLVRAAQLRPELAAEYAELEAEIGHRFRNDMSMAEIINAAEQAATAEHSEETATVELGQGQLWWPRYERQTDRYGTVLLLTGPDAEDYVSFENAPVGQPGRLDHYRSSLPRLDTNMVRAPDAAARQGDAAEPWFAVWLAGYRVITDHGNLAASYAGTRPLRIRPITWRLPNIF